MRTDTVPTVNFQLEPEGALGGGGEWGEGLIHRCTLSPPACEKGA